ncbi:MAG: hypothetical protein QGH37_18610, partial [Candidatus Poribacteria bacterium]|nr:hypothetical protein [Candidatus Poribacteria bacterium]
MTLPAYLSAFLSLLTLALAFFCWRRRHLAVALPLATICLCLSLALAFEVPKLLAHQLSDPALALAQILFWAGWRQITMVAFYFSTLWLVLNWRPLPWPASWQRLFHVGLVLRWLIFSYLRLFQLELLAGSFEYDPVSHRLLFQLTAWAKLWLMTFGLIQLTSLSWLLLAWIQSSSPAQRQQAKWLLL